MRAHTSRRLSIFPLTNEQLHTLMDKETDEPMKAAYGQMLQGCVEHPAQRRWYTAWQIALKSRERVGDMCFKGPPVNGEVEIGYGIDGPYRGRGYAVEALDTAVRWAFSQPGVLYVTAETEPKNRASRRVLDKAGFMPAGEGNEGPRFERIKPASSWTVFYLAIGVGCGVPFGALTNSLAPSVAVGLAVGLTLGIILDAKEKHDRAQQVTLHAQRRQRLKSDG